MLGVSIFIVIIQSTLQTRLPYAVKICRWQIDHIALDKDRHECYKFVRSLYEHWVPKYLEWLNPFLEALPKASAIFPETTFPPGSIGLSQATYHVEYSSSWCNLCIIRARRAEHTTGTRPYTRHVSAIIHSQTQQSTARNTKAAEKIIWHSSKGPSLCIDIPFTVILVFDEPRLPILLEATKPLVGNLCIWRRID